MISFDLMCGKKKIFPLKVGFYKTKVHEDGSVHYTCAWSKLTRGADPSTLAHYIKCQTVGDTNTLGGQSSYYCVNMNKSLFQPSSFFACWMYIGGGT